MAPIEPISFSRLAITKKAWGEERLIHNADGYCGKILVFNKGAAFSDHWHALKTESWTLLRGHLRLDYYDLTVGKRLSRELVTGDVIHVPAGNPHKLTALEDTEVAEVSTIHYDNDSYRLSPSSAPSDSQAAKSAEQTPVRIIARQDMLHSSHGPEWSNAIYDVNDQQISTGVAYIVTPAMRAAHPKRKWGWTPQP